jgi:hypothetical protein
MDHKSLIRRAEKIRSRRLVLAWEYRQRHHSAGTWHRIRVALAYTAQAWEISESDADMLEVSGMRPLLVGSELQPEKRLFYIDSSILRKLEYSRSIPVRIGSDFLNARSIVLLRYSGLLDENAGTSEHAD